MDEENKKGYLVYFTESKLWCFCVQAPNEELAAKAAKAYYRNEKSLANAHVLGTEIQDEALVSYEVCDARFCGLEKGKIFEEGEL